MDTRRYLLGTVLVLVAVGLFTVVFGGPTTTAHSPSLDTETLVQPGDTESFVWPYTSRTRSVEGRTLALNVVVYGPPERVRRAFEHRSDVNWTTTEGDADVGEPADDGVVEGSPWGGARGAARYTYVTTDPNASGRWVESTYQLGTGTYLGQRIHVRAYPSLSGDWTALQAHTEYWDWFRLRHTVTGVSPGARFVERDLRDEPFVTEVSREYHGLAGGGSDGWLTVIRFASVTLVAGAVVPLGRRSRDLVDLVLPVGIVGIVLGVRAVGIAAEGLFPAVDPKLFAGVLYPVLVAGPPSLVFALGRERSAVRIALLAAAGLGGGIVLDMGSLGVQIVPIRLALHRVALAGALALFAVGVARTDRRTIVGGLAAWLLALAAPLAGLI